MRNRLFTIALVVMVAALLVAVVPTDRASANGNVHCVKYGETLYGIASWYGTSAYAIAHANGIWNPNYIRAGTCLVIPTGYGYGNPGYNHGGYNPPGYGYGNPPGYKNPPGYGHGNPPGYGWSQPGYGSGHGGKKGYGGGNVHCVQHGETLSSIAWRYGTSAWAISNANGLWNPNYIRAGQCLVIPTW